MTEKSGNSAENIENADAVKPSGRAVTIEQRRRAQAKRLAANLRANLTRRKNQARQRKAEE